MTKERLQWLRRYVDDVLKSRVRYVEIDKVTELLIEVSRLAEENCLLSDLLRDTAMRLRAHTEHVENRVEKTHGR